jgi:hypothetical protein
VQQQFLSSPDVLHSFLVEEEQRLLAKLDSVVTPWKVKHLGRWEPVAASETGHDAE